MFVHPATALQLAAERQRDLERTARIRARASADERAVRPLRRRGASY